MDEVEWIFDARTSSDMKVTGLMMEVLYLWQHAAIRSRTVIHDMTGGMSVPLS